MYSWKLNNSLLNDNKEGIRREIKDFIELSKNEDKSYPNLWHTMKVVLRGKFRVLSAFIKKLE